MTAVGALHRGLLRNPIGKSSTGSGRQPRSPFGQLSPEHNNVRQCFPTLLQGLRIKRYSCSRGGLPTNIRYG
jgi:hypothetical protein